MSDDQAQAETPVANQPSLGPKDIAWFPDGTCEAIVHVMATPVHGAWRTLYHGPARLLFDRHERTITVLRSGSSAITFSPIKDWLPEEQVYDARDYNIQIIDVAVTPAVLSAALASYGLTVVEGQTGGTVEIDAGALYRLLGGFEQTLRSIAFQAGHRGDPIVENVASLADGKERGRWYAEARRLARQQLPVELDPVGDLPRPT